MSGRRAGALRARPSPGFRAGVLAVVLAALLAGCTGALLTQVRYATGHLPEPARELRWTSKRDVLADLGPPLDVLPLARGDVFVYRVADIELTVVNVNTGIVTGVFTPLYMDIVGRRVDRALYVFFDDEGRVAYAAARGAR